jgi:cytidylate kinase
MERKIILTVGRQYGSGGRVIGKQLAERLSIHYYDNELITLAAQESGLCPEVFEKADEKVSKGLAYAFSVGFSNMGIYMPCNDVLSNERLFQLQSDTIRNLAENESAVIVGRCADYILRDHPNLLSFFISAKKEFRIRNIVQMHQIDEKEAFEIMIKADKSRAAYYNYYTDKEWGHASSYDFTVDASVLGIDETVDFIVDFIGRN